MDAMELPVTRYALSGDVSVAYQMMGDGPLDKLKSSTALGTILAQDHEGEPRPPRRVNTSFGRARVTLVAHSARPESTSSGHCET